MLSTLTSCTIENRFQLILWGYYAFIYFFFILAGLAEIGGGYLVWLYMRDDKGPVYLLAGAIILFLYGLIPTFQPEASFGKVYAAYGGVFIALSILWGWLVDGLRPDTYDIIGGLICLVGVYIIMYAPR